MGDLTLRGVLKLGYSAKINKIFYKKQKCFVCMWVGSTLFKLPPLSLGRYGTPVTILQGMVLCSV